MNYGFTAYRWRLALLQAGYFEGVVDSAHFFRTSSASPRHSGPRPRHSGPRPRHSGQELRRGDLGGSENRKRPSRDVAERERGQPPPCNLLVRPPSEPRRVEPQAEMEVDIHHRKAAAVDHED